MSSRPVSSIRLLIKTLLPTVVVLYVHILRLFLFPLAYEWDQLMHFLGGASMAWIAWFVIKTFGERGLLPILPRWFRGIASFSFAGLIGLLWELYEYAVFIWWIPSMNIQLPDTEQDMLLDVSGAAILMIVLILIERYQVKDKR